MDSIISTFHIDWKVIIAQLFNFAVVFVVLYIFALKPLSKLMDERSEKIAKGINDAKENAETLNKTKQEYDALLSQARVEAQKIFEEGKKEAESKKVLMIESAKQDVDVMIENGKKTLLAEKTKMVGEAKKEVVFLAIKAAEKLLEVKDGSLNEKALKELKDL